MKGYEALSPKMDMPQSLCRIIRPTVSFPTEEHNIGRYQVILLGDGTYTCARVQTLYSTAQTERIGLKTSTN